uniref:Uncharacterized protein n=1 Tax=Onchocerca volvulus TaxID=6282 RepID=A0A8R1XUT5_ONCVO
MGSTGAGATYQAYNQLIRSSSLHLPSFTKSTQQVGINEQVENDSNFDLPKRSGN